MTKEIAKYESLGGDSISLSRSTVRNYLCSNPNVTDQEVMMFIGLCKAKRMNPFERDCYLIKYNSAPAQIVAGKDYFVKRASHNPNYRGMQAGITVINNGQLIQREGSMVLKDFGDVLVGGWCRVFVEGFSNPIYEEVALSEYDTGKSQWAKMPATMIRKVAMTHALREAFPDDFGGLYAQEEMAQAGVESEFLPQEPVQAPQQEAAVIEMTAEEIAPQQAEYARACAPVEAYEAYAYEEEESF